MNETCPTDRELLSLLRENADHERMRHVRDCPRCRAGIAAYRRFLALTTEQQSEGGEDLDRRLHEDAAVGRIDCALRERILGESVRPSLLDRIRAAQWRWQWVSALGAAAILVGIILLVTDMQSLLIGPVRYRDQSPPVHETMIRTTGERWLPDGSIELSWRPISGADSYRISLLGRGMELIASIEAATESTAILPEVLPRTTLGLAVWWQVEALESGDVLAESALQPLPVD